MLVLMRKGPHPSKPRQQRLDERTDKSGNCWLWTGSVFKHRGGYGQFYDDDQRVRRAHRVAFEEHHGIALTSDEVVLHLCDTPLCVRPDHLAIGTQADNLADMRRKGRGHLFTEATAERGTDRYNAKLDPDKVRRLRAARAAGESITALAREIGVTQAAAQMAAVGKTWKHIT
jgi:hypothetical protein